jgi:hypothetical protein
MKAAQNLNRRSMSRDQLNNKIKNLVEQVSSLKTMLEEPADTWDIRAVAAQCKQTGAQLFVDRILVCRACLQ